MIRNVAVVASVMAEALAVYTVAELLAASDGDGRGTVPAVLFVLTALVAFGVIRLADELDLGGRAAPLAIGLVAFVVLYGSLRISFAGDAAIWQLGWVVDFLGNAGDVLDRGAHTIFPAMLLIGLWARSALRANDDVELESMPRTVGIPFVLVTGVVILGAATDRSGEVARAGIVFYGLAVLALACSQLALSGATFGELRAGGVTAALLGGTAAVVVVCVVVFGLAFGVLRPIIGPPLGAVTEFILLVVLVPPAWVLEHLLRWLLQDAQFPELSADIAEQAGEAGGEEAAGEPSTAREVGNFAMRIVALVVGVAAVALVVAWFSRLRRRVRVHPETPVASAVAGSVRDDLAGLWRGLFRRGGERSRVPADATPAERLYLEALAAAERAGDPREAAETPEEYAPRLRAALHTPVADDITAAFEQARYAGRPPDPGTVAELERRWRALPPD
ncbi:MAG: DUF4129 domain-containing protein [Dehalococcoidia bacterium]|nr:DUF4129 domain-containing protein [Dehalococcoidia bacterium]